MISIYYPAWGRDRAADFEYECFCVDNDGSCCGDCAADGCPPCEERAEEAKKEQENE